MAEEKIARIAREIYENVGGTQNVKKIDSLHDSCSDDHY
ncbi:hypothetical protein LMG9449_1744 [Lactococcus lactis subsp. lactis]|uniref:Uncharacterized protein n=1 Tax=Lactococcus lactis subsp. lactis TaxID=1360 RepID=A0A0V8DV72_LACLL|nr:hypothetical protein LMG9449_1744 [Lactococcus lactis subsp. lactis]